jgi:hypothetical protein
LFDIKNVNQDSNQKQHVARYGLYSAGRKSGKGRRDFTRTYLTTEGLRLVAPLFLIISGPLIMMSIKTPISLDGDGDREGL